MGFIFLPPPCQIWPSYLLTAERQRKWSPELQWCNVQWEPQVSVQRRKRRKSWYLGPFLVLKCEPFLVKGGRRPPFIPPLGPLPPGPPLEASPSFHPAVSLVQKSAYTTFKHHNFLNTAATQILLTSLKNLKSPQLNLFSPLWMKIDVYGSAGHCVYCTVLMYIVASFAAMKGFVCEWKQRNFDEWKVWKKSDLSLVNANFGHGSLWTIA